MNRKPVYFYESSKIRLISAPNGLWQAQRYIGRDERRRAVDSGWQDIGCPCPRDDAARKALYAK